MAYMVREDRFMFNVAGLIGDQVPTLSEHEEHSQYFVDNYKNLRVKWFRTSIEESLDHIYEVLNAADKAARSSLRRSSKDISGKVPAKAEEEVRSLASNRPPSIHSLPPHLGLSLAYPRRSDMQNIYSPTTQPEPSGVVGEDVGLLDFPYSWGTSNSSKEGGAGKRLIRMIQGFSPFFKDDQEHE